MTTVSPVDHVGAHFVVDRLSWNDVAWTDTIPFTRHSPEYPVRERFWVLTPTVAPDFIISNISHSIIKCFASTIRKCGNARTTGCL